MSYVLKLYRYLFARPCFARLNHLLHRLSLSGLGILNYEDSRISGEKVFLTGHLSGLTSGIVLDVGANIGRYSSEVLAINPKLQLHAFEPHPRNYQQLVNNITHPDFHAINAAVGNEAGSLFLYDYEEDDGSTHASLYRQVIEEIHQSRAIGHQVEVIMLDSYLTDQGIYDIDLLKIDTEGNEFAVLQGLQQFIINGRIKAIHFEFNEMNIISRVFFKDFWDLLPNYQLFRLLPEAMLPINRYDPLTCELFAYQNIIALLKTQPRQGRI